MAKGVILIAVENKGNREVLQTCLKQYYDIEVHFSEENFDKPFDLGIFDGVGLNRLRTQVEKHRADNPNLFLPILLITSRQDIGVLTNNLWQTIDEIILSPIEKMELIARVEMLLRARRYSVDLAETNAHIQEGAALAERQRLGRELHDTVTQTLFLASTLAQSVPITNQKNPELGRKQLQEVAALNQSAMSQMRLLLLEMRPDSIIRTPMQDLLKQLAQAAQGSAKITMHVDVDKIGILPETIHLALYRIAQEAVNNIIKHSEATTASIVLRIHDTKLQLTVADNGRGFDVTGITGRLGLQGIQERSAQLGAAVDIQSNPNQGGTNITVSLPAPDKIRTPSQ